MTSMEQNQDLNERLRNIFSLCDDDDDGYISADHFAKLAQDHFGAAGLQVGECPNTMIVDCQPKQLSANGRGTIITLCGAIISLV